MKLKKYEILKTYTVNLRGRRDGGRYYNQKTEEKFYTKELKSDPTNISAGSAK